jgi:predicted amidohydrolase
MKITEKNDYPVRYEDILVFPEYFSNYKNSRGFYSTISHFKDDKINYYVVGVGSTYESPYTTVLLLDRSLNIRGVRQKISIFLGEDSTPSLKLQAFRLTKDRVLGIVICKEVLHTAIAEVYRMMDVNLVAVTIGSGQFWDLQRQSWIDQLSLFSDICQAPLVCACGATKDEGGINLIIER